MPKFKVMKSFIDTHSKEEYTENQEIEMTVERSIEAATNLAKFGGGFFVAVEDETALKTPNDLTVAELKVELEKLNIDYPSDAKKAELLALFEGAGE
ncbi:HeH/LEM domain-containing protein [Solibacillus sp. FSL R7-0668]|uniref:HeH/LEM domain-containing protein n=1 Tax=Solibacillus sp. FSL R7-0668 TaxID=2921688 RepID=UPI0030F5D6E8